MVTYAASGQWGNAAISGFATLVPLLPSSVARAGKGILKKGVERATRRHVTNEATRKLVEEVASSGKVTKQAGTTVADLWHKVTFDNVKDSMDYRATKHGKGRTIEQYTQDAMNFFQENQHLGTEVVLKDGTPGIKIQTGYGKNKVGGYWTRNGKLVTFWD